MNIENVNLQTLLEIARALGIHLVEQKAKEKGTVKVLMRPVVGSKTFRALSTAGSMKNSLCPHGQFAFMSRALAIFPDAVFRTWVNRWDYVIFQGSAKPWTFQQIAETRNSATCDCTPEMIDDAMRTPDELREAIDYEPPPFTAVLPPSEAVKCYRQGKAAREVERKEFHESPFPHSGDATVSDEDYERGYHWRRGWNDAALQESGNPIRDLTGAAIEKISRQEERLSQ